MDQTETQIALLVLAIQARVPVLLWGAPGVGKSAVIAAIFRDLGWPLGIILSAIRDPTDFGGFPVATDKIDKRSKEHYTVMSMLPTAWAQRLSVRELGDAPAGLFLEEINQAPPSVQAALMRVVLDGFVGDEQLGPNVARIAAANPPEQAAGGWNLAAPLANRFFHINWSLSAEYWANGLVAGFPAPRTFNLPNNWEDQIPMVYGLIGAYIRSHAASMLDVPKDEAKASLPWPSPRSWTMGARLMAAAQAMGMPEGIHYECLQGCVGQAAATMFIEYKSKLDLPSAEEMLANPKKVKWPTNRGDKAFAMLSTAAAFAISKRDVKVWGKAWELIGLAAKNYKDVAAIAAKSLAMNRPSGAEIPEECAQFYEAYQLAGLVK